ncbi:MAG: amidohydrolase family protein, partial [Clostridia bacterium]|nr:amidohydrolase family protein [Clostridia bacterium]
MKKTKITGKFVIGHDGEDHVIYENGEVVFQGDTILFVGHDYPEEVDEIINAGLAIVSPGFIDLDAVVDSDHALIDVAFPQNPQDNFKMGEKYRTEDPFSLEDFRIRQRLSIAMLIMNGITTAMPIAGDLFRGWAETYEEFEELARNATELGLRMYLGPSYRAAASYGGPVDLQRGEKSISDAFRFARDFDGAAGGLLRGFLSPCQIPYLTEDFLKRTKEFSDAYGMPVRLHACERTVEWDYLKSKYGMTTIDYLDSIGFLGPRLMIPHTIVAKDSELKILADRGVSVVSTPMAEAKLGWGLVSFGKYLKFGINMALGT